MTIEVSILSGLTNTAGYKAFSNNLCYQLVILRELHGGSSLALT